jgi:hypothetical protein
MKRKVGIALLVIATVLAGTPEAVRQFHDLNKALRHWAGTNLGGSFLVYAEDNSNERALPDRYDYHQVAPLIRLSSYGLTASLSVPSTHNVTPCPFAHHPIVERAVQAPRVQATAHATEQVARSQQRSARTVQREQMAREAREIRRALRLTIQSLNGEVSEPALVESLSAPELATKSKALKSKQPVETLKPRRSAPVRIARLSEGDVPFSFTLAPDPDVKGFDADKNHR